MQISAQLVKELRQRSGAGMMECKKALVQTEGDIEAAIEWLRKQGLAKADKKASRVAAEGRIVGAEEDGHAVLVEVNSETDFVAKDKGFLAFADKVAQAALDHNVDTIEALKSTKLDDLSVEETAKALVATIGEKIEVRRMVAVTTTGHLGYYVHGGRIGVLVALDGGSQELAKGIAMHVAAMNPQYVSAEDVPAEFIAKEKDIAQSQLSDKDKTKPEEILEKIISGKVKKSIAEITLSGQPFVLDTNMSVGQALEKAGAKVAKLERLAVGEGVEKKDEDFASEVMKQAGLA